MVSVEGVRGSSPEGWTAKSGLAEGFFHLIAGDADVGDVKTVLREFGTEDDKAPMTVRWDKTFRITPCEEAVFAVYQVVSEPPFEHARKGKALIR
jgi:hypothetical protein